MSSKNPTVTGIRIEVSMSLMWMADVRRIPSWSDDLTFATITSEGNGRNTTIRNTTKNEGFVQIDCDHRINEPLYHRKPSPYRTLPSPA